MKEYDDYIYFWSQIEYWIMICKYTTLGHSLHSNFYKLSADAQDSGIFWSVTDKFSGPSVCLSVCKVYNSRWKYCSNKSFFHVTSASLFSHRECSSPIACLAPFWQYLNREFHVWLDQELQLTWLDFFIYPICLTEIINLFILIVTKFNETADICCCKSSGLHLSALHIWILIILTHSS